MEMEENLTIPKWLQKTPEGLMHTALQLFNLMGGEEKRKERAEANYHVLSPRFAPVMPDKAGADNMALSPSILAFYEAEKGDRNNIASIPSLLKTAGLRKQDRQLMLGALMKAAGVNEVVDDAVQLLDNVNFFGEPSLRL